ncbi:hypothetical protein TTRE_0000100901 [Trichuris trichiura]|uniref:DUF7107 domain-containing protein n=1 Tax=Trichuris trichiura TaxID=36087 RepID=A0A077YXF7_TRITR|nr:hypothetical protein TTRE_0000100901 [Trichuris trichiura]
MLAKDTSTALTGGLYALLLNVYVQNLCLLSVFVRLTPTVEKTTMIYVSMEEDASTPGSRSCNFQEECMGQSVCIQYHCVAAEPTEHTCHSQAQCGVGERCISGMCFRPISKRRRQRYPHEYNELAGFDTAYGPAYSQYDQMYEDSQDIYFPPTFASYEPPRIPQCSGVEICPAMCCTDSLEESLVDSTFVGKYRRSAPSFISTPYNADNALSLRVFTPTPTSEKPRRVVQFDKTVMDRLSDLDEVSNENTKSASVSKASGCIDQKSRCPSTSIVMDANDDCNKLPSHLPKMEIGNVIQLSNVKYSVQRLLDGGPFNGSYALYPLDKSERFIYAKVVQASSDEFLLSKQMRELLCSDERLRMSANAFALAVNSYKFLDCELLTFAGYRNRSLAEVMVTVRLKKIKLHEGIFAYFLLEILKMVRAMQLIGVVHYSLDLGNLLFNDSANFLEDFRLCRRSDDYRRLPVALLKLSNFRLAEQWPTSENSNWINSVGMARCIYSCICGDDLELQRRPWTRLIDCTDRLPFSWNRHLWNDFFSSFPSPRKNDVTYLMDKFESEFCNVVYTWRLQVIRELSLLKEI